MEAHLLTGILGLFALVVLIAIRMPIAYSMILVGGVGHFYPQRPGHFPGAAQEPRLFPVLDLRPVRRADVHPDGLHRDPRTGLSRDLFAAANAWLGWLRGESNVGYRRLREASAQSAVPRSRPPPPWDRSRCRSTAPLSLPGRARHRHAGRRRGARHPLIPPTLGGAGRLRHYRRGQHHHHVYGRDAARRPRDYPVSRDHRGLRFLSFGVGPKAALSSVPSSSARRCASCQWS